MGKKILIFLLVIFILGGIGAGIYVFIDISKNENIDLLKINIAKEGKKDNKPKEPIFGDVINVLLLGVDSSTNRRSKGQVGFNTDTMILLSVNIKTNKILLTSVPRDLWINGNKINALYTVYGEDTLVDAFKKITGQEIDGVIRVDFDQFMWVVDSLGGVPVSVQNSFTDSSFPNYTDTNTVTVSFTKGEETMGGMRALQFSRSRKGDNGEGSDLMRAKRQHLVLQGMVNAVSQPNSKFWPMSIDNFFSAIVNEGVSTTLTLDDCYYLWDFYKDREKYQIESLVVGSDYVYHPGMYPQSEYHAWVFIAKEPGFENLHKDIQAKLDGTYVDPNAVVDTQTQETTQQ